MRSQRCNATNADHSEGVCAFESGRAQNGTVRLECALLRQLGGDVQRANDPAGQQQRQQQPPPHVGLICATDPFSEPVAVLHTRPLVWGGSIRVHALEERNFNRPLPASCPTTTTGELRTSRSRLTSPATGHGSERKRMMIESFEVRVPCFITRRTRATVPASHYTDD
jgi:hypothetical protein